VPPHVPAAPAGAVVRAIPAGVLTAAGWLLAAALGTVVAAEALPGGQQPAVSAAEQKLPRNWTVAELLPSVTEIGPGQDWARGREVFRRTACGVCHAFGSESEGTGLAPDLTGVGSRYTRDFILQSIIEPSATLNGQFFHTTFTLKNGDVVTGSVLDIVDKTIVVAPVMMNPQVTVEIAAADVKSEAPSELSPMPAGLLNELTREEIVALMAFLDAGGDRNAPVYRKK
jgi:putative heme-binding domain-containing protein